MGAAFLDVPELELDKDEAEKLGNAVKEVSKYYAVAIDPKKVAIMNLFSVCGFIYGTRVIAYRARKSKEGKKEKLTVMPRQEQQQAAAASAAAPTGRGPMIPSQVWSESAEMQAPQ